MTNYSEIMLLKSKTILEVDNDFKNYQNVIIMLMIHEFYLEFVHLVHLRFFGGTKVVRFEQCAPMVQIIGTTRFETLYHNQQ